MCQGVTWPELPAVPRSSGCIRGTTDAYYLHIHSTLPLIPITPHQTPVQNADSQTARTGFGLALGGLLLIDPLQHIHFPQHQRSVVLLALGVVVTWVLVGVGIVGSLPAPGVQLGVNGGGGREGEEEEEDRVGAL